MTTNGTIVAWLDHGRSTRGFVPVEAYLIAEQRIVTLVEQLPTSGYISDLNLVDGMLYYSDLRQGATRIYRYNLATHQEEQVRTPGSAPVVADGTLLWTESVWRGKYAPPHMSLHMQPLQRPQEARILDTGNTGLSGYGVDGDRVVWAFYPFAGQDQVHVYDRTAGITTTLPFTNVVHPIIYGDTVAWTQMAGGGINRRFEYSIMSYNLTTHTLATLVATETAQLQPITMLAEHGFVFKVNSFSAQGGQSLYIVPPRQQAHGPPPCPLPNPPPKSAVCPGNDVPGCLPEPFRAYWEANGGLAVFGYPISDVDDDEIVYDEGCRPIWAGRTLWFERDRLEDHGEGRVLAGRLGVELLRARGTPWQGFDQVDSAPPGCAYFPEMRHSLCEPFLSHWQQQGGLARFGYPITEPFETTIAIDNGTWQGTVQYFERRRMEDHTPDGNGILLGLLGRELLNRFTGAMDAEYREAVRNYEPASTPTPAALPTAPRIGHP